MRYETAEAFRRALEATLDREARSSGKPLAYLRKRVAFERFLARIFAPTPADAPFILKGAFALGLRVRERRTTQDLDLALSAAAAQGDTDPVEAIREVAERDIDDFFQFRIANASEAHNQGLATLRLSVDARLPSSFRRRSPRRPNVRALQARPRHGDVGPHVDREPGRVLLP